MAKAAKTYRTYPDASRDIRLQRHLKPLPRDSTVPSSWCCPSGSLNSSRLGFPRWEFRGLCPLSANTEAVFHSTTMQNFVIGPTSIRSLHGTPPRPRCQSRSRLGRSRLQAPVAKAISRPRQRRLTVTIVHISYPLQGKLAGRQ